MMFSKLNIVSDNDLSYLFMHKCLIVASQWPITSHGSPIPGLVALLYETKYLWGVVKTTYVLSVSFRSLFIAIKQKRRPS